MMNKTKAALQGRQCNYKKLKPSQITTLIDQVNSGYKLTAPLAQLIRDIRKSAHTVPNYGKLTVIPSAILRPLILLVFSQSKSFASWWVYPNLDRPDMSDSSQWGKSTPMADTLRNSGLAEGEIPPSKQNHRVIAQPFGSMPRLSSSRRSNLLIQPALLSSPSSFIAAAKRSDRSTSRRSCTTFRSFWFSLVDIDVHPYILRIKVINVHHCIAFSKAKPGSALTLTGPLTTNDR